MIGFPIPVADSIYNTNAQPIPTVYNEGYSQWETIAKMLDNTNQYIKLMNFLNDNKLGKTGDFQGTWNGLQMSESSLGITSDWSGAKGTFATVTQRLDNFDSKIQMIDGGFFGDYSDPILGDIDGGIL